MMTIENQLILFNEVKILGFTGGIGRDYLADAVSSALGRENKKVVFSHLKIDMVPRLGSLLLHTDRQKLISQIESYFENNNMVYVGKNSKQGFVEGIDVTTVKLLAQQKIIDYIFLFLGTPVEFSIFSPQTIHTILKTSCIEQLFYCFQIDKIDQELENSLFENESEFLDNFPKYKSINRFTHQLFLDYLTSQNKGILSLFKQKWPASIVFTDIKNELLENKVINLARELFPKQIKHIYFANIKENLVKKVAGA
jgi:hypothetical protein